MDRLWQKLKNFYHLNQAHLAAFYFSFPARKLQIIGVTGTDGKTSSVHMIYHILSSAGIKVSMISSIEAKIGEKSYDTGFHVTTPSAWQVQKYLKQAVEAGSKYFVLEATSHGLDQNRLAALKFTVAVITNITHEHLNYHKTWQRYALSKAKLLKNVGYSILNIDDRSFVFLKNRADGKIITYSLSRNADFNLTKYPIKLKIRGDYNKSNALAATATAVTLGVKRAVALKSLANFPGTKGRMENIDLGQDFEVFIDFAHTPNGLEQALKALNSELLPRRQAGTSHKSQLICVFGAAGDRDKLKRPLMGQVADKYADIIVLTAEDPRSERVEEICQQIARGIRNKRIDNNCFVIPDRKEAINFAIYLAQKDDIVAFFGKSHEKSMAYGNKELPWDEFKEVEAALRRRLNKKK